MITWRPANTSEQLLTADPQLTLEDLRARLEYAAALAVAEVDRSVKTYPANRAKNRPQNLSNDGVRFKIICNDGSSPPG